MKAILGFTVVISNTKHLIKHHTFLKISLCYRKSHVVKLDHNSDAIIRFNLQDCHFINIDRRNFYFLGNTHTESGCKISCFTQTNISRALKTNKTFVIILQMLGLICYK